MADEQNLASLQRVNEELKKNPAVANSMREQIAKLENEIKRSDQRHESTVQALLLEINDRVAAEARLRAEAAAAQQAAQPPPPQAEAPPVPAAAAPAPPAPRPQEAGQGGAGQSFDALMDAATEKFQHGKPADAMKLVQSAIAREPKRWEGYEFAGQIAVMLEDYGLGTSMFQKALECAPAEYQPDIRNKLDDLKKRAAK